MAVGILLAVVGLVFALSAIPPISPIAVLLLFLGLWLWVSGFRLISEARRPS